MRSREERVAETKRRIAARQRKEQQRRSKIAMFSAAAACLVLIVGVSFSMPGVVAGIRPGDYAGYETAASMYGGSTALGYIVIGLLSFLLGVCVTVLCFRLRQMNREDNRDRKGKGRHGAD